MRICLISPGHLSTNPRLVKEARAFMSAGHDVHVVCGRYNAWGAEADHALRGAFRQVTDVPFGRSQARILTYLRQTLSRHMARGLVRGGCNASRMSEAAHAPVVSDLCVAAQQVAADLYVGHYVAALPAAARAAARHHSRYAFDAEDFHLGDLPELPQHALDKRLIHSIERRYLPGAAYVTAASPLIAQAYAEAYGIERPTVVLNTFPASTGPAAPTPEGRAQPGPSLYWFSQTIGPGRGLELAVEAISLSKRRPHLILRGTPARGFREAIETLAGRFGVRDRLHFLAPVNPSELERDGASFDLGYVGELTETTNRQIALTNKLFSYLTSGIPVVASDIPAHRDIAPAFGQAMRLFPIGNVQALAEAIDGFLADPRQLAEARRHAWELGRARFNWETEQTKLVVLVRERLPLTA